MPSNCPSPPLTPSRLDVVLDHVGKDAKLWRFHGVLYPGNSLNPNSGKRIEVASEGARFNPFPGAPQTNIGTLYAAGTFGAAALESVFHDVAHTPAPAYARIRLNDWRVSRLAVRRELTVLRLINPVLRQVPVPHRSTSLEEQEIVHSPVAEYPVTRRWAMYFHDSLCQLDGLAWRPRLGGTGWAYVFFGDRLSPADLSVLSGPVEIARGPAFQHISKVAKQASIHISKPFRS